MNKELHYKKTIELLQSRLAELSGAMAKESRKIRTMMMKLDLQREEIIRDEEKIGELLQKFQDQEANYKDEIVKRDQQIRELIEGLEAREHNYESEIASKDGHIKELVGKFEYQERTYNDEVVKRDKQIEQLTEKVGENERNYKDEIARREKQIRELAERSEEREAQIKDLIEKFQNQEGDYKDEIARREVQIKDLVEKFEEQEGNYKDEIAKRDESVYSLDGQRFVLEKRLNEILSTKTWRLRQFIGKLGLDYLIMKRRAYSSAKQETGVVEPAGLFSSGAETGFSVAGKTQKKGDFGTGSHYDLVCLSVIDWSFRYQRPQQILSQFAKNGSRIFYISSDFLDRGGESYQCREIGRNIFEVRIRANSSMSIYRSDIDGTILNDMMDSIEELRKDALIMDAVCMVHLPFWRPLAKGIKDNFGWRIVYDCMDEHAGFSTNGKAMVENEELLARDADIVTAASSSLYEKMKKFNERCFLIPNAADVDHFSYLPPNNYLKDMGRPVIGYYGAIAEWFDNELVEHLALNRKEWNFVFIGHTFGADLSALEKLPNVFFLGEKTYTELPKYLYWFDVCIIPFKLNSLTMATNPVKFYEYMSSGKKVVSVELPELLPYSRYVYLARDKKSFLERIEEALIENDPELVAERTAVARNNSWEKRYEQFRINIERLCPKVSIIVVTYNNLDYTRMCIESIFEKTQYPNLEIILVDNNSKDGTVDFLRGLAGERRNVKVIMNEVNKGFARANNQGISASSGDFLVLMNNDTIVTRGWLSKLLSHLRDDTIGAVGPVTNWCGNEARIDVPYKSIEGLDEFSERYNREHAVPRFFDIRVLAMYCFVMRRNLMNEVGLLDERFEVGMFEDDDFAHRIRLKGYRVVCAEDVFIHHFGESSFNGLKESGEYKRIFEKNRRLFEKKWGMSWEPHTYAGSRRRGGTS